MKRRVTVSQVVQGERGNTSPAIVIGAARDLLESVRADLAGARVRVTLTIEKGKAWSQHKPRGARQ